MGSLVSLGVGKFEVDWAKNMSGNDHRPLFQQGDGAEVPYFYADGLVENKPGYAKPLRLVRDRLDLLGYSLAEVERQYNELRKWCELGDLKGVPNFEDFHQRVANTDVWWEPPEFDSDDHGFSEFFADRIFPVLYPHDMRELSSRRELGEFMENLHPWAILRLLAENPKNLDENVTWRTADIIEGGWSDESEFVPSLPRARRFLIVTEGTSDAKILDHALRLLAPQIADFFYFVDMDNGYPFTGTGNLHRFSQGLASIGLLNRVLLLYDNDAEGIAKFNETVSLRLPPNIRCMKLPDESDFVRFRTVGPEGEAASDINGRAASIECFLDHSWETDRPARVRWAAYIPAVSRWQGALEDKKAYTRAFLSLRSHTTDYNFTRLGHVVGAVLGECRELGALDLDNLR